MPTSEEIKALFAEFPKDAISWRAQTLTKDGDKAMALAYIDARDVMDRLDDVCGASDWQDRYEFHGARTVCYLSIRVDNEWITKADGAGDSDVEAEKGAISDALKRAAVKWGVGRYLYDLPAPWVPCESYERNGKKYWKRWTADPWIYVKGHKASSALMKHGLEEIDNDLLDCQTIKAVNLCAKAWGKKMAEECWTKDFQDIAIPKFKARRDQINASEDQSANDETEQGKAA